jgi:glutathione S-transferase
MAVKQAEQARTGTKRAEGGAPILWHLKVSHYNEKVRWALDYKGVPHVRRAAPPGPHRKIAQRLTGSSTFPVLVVDGEAIGDSTRIIAALERRHPDPPLYPEDPDLRRRALEIEDFFDEELGPHSRLLVIHHTLPDPDLALGAFSPDLSGLRQIAMRKAFPLLRRRAITGFGIDDQSVERAYRQVRLAGERFWAELEPSGYLVGDRFTVADLTLAALVAPAVAPVQFPYPQPQRGHRLLEPIRAALAESRLLEWARDIYARHRGRSAEITR